MVIFRRSEPFEGRKCRLLSILPAIQTDSTVTGRAVILSSRLMVSLGEREATLNSP
jgi:hypothetical protein